MSSAATTPITQLVADGASAAGALSIPSHGLAAFRGSLGSNFERYGNLHVLQHGDGKDTVVLYAAGNSARIHNLATGYMRYVQGRDGGGVAAVAVHPSRRVFAVAERRWTGGGGPRVYVYAYPSLEMLRVLEGGTERAYSDICFSVAPEGCPAPDVAPLQSGAAAPAAAPPPPEAAPTPTPAGEEGAGAASPPTAAAAAEGGAPAPEAAPPAPEGAKDTPEAPPAPEGATDTPEAPPAPEGATDTPEAPPAPAEGGEAAAAPPPADAAPPPPADAAAPPPAEAAAAAEPLPAADRIVTVGGFPDFSLIVWDWAASRPMLRTKAFGQDVFNCRFSPDDPGKLVTSGVGHIRFWRLAETFTGLKLQVRPRCQRNPPVPPLPTHPSLL
jgi:hypothetical protein